MSSTKIEWTDATWNCVTGCTKVSAGCKNCYAETLANRFWATQYPPVDGRPRRFTDVICHPERLEIPLRWRKPRRVFVNSMSDMFHRDIPLEFVAAVFGVMAATPHHTYQILTKRPGRALEFFAWLDGQKDAVSGYPSRPQECLQFASSAIQHWPSAAKCDDYNLERHGRRSVVWPLPNVWLGVSVEDQATADARIPLLLKTPAAMRFLSYEPALEAVDFTTDVCPNCSGLGRMYDHRWREEFSAECKQCDGAGRVRRLLQYVDWVIVGGESGGGARPFDVQWARDTIAQCKAAEVPCFVKQLGANTHGRYWRDRGDSGHDDWRGDYLVNGVRDRGRYLYDAKGGDMEEWPEDLRVRQFPYPA